MSRSPSFATKTDVPLPPAPSRRAATIPFLVAGALFMEMLDSTIITTALPAIGRSFDVPAVSLTIGISAYLIALAVCIPASGWLADRLGARIVFACAVTLFTLASLLCGLSQGLASFTAARVLQGIAGGAMTPVGRLIVLRAAPGEGLIRAIATTVWPGLIAPVLGPPLGGFLVLHLSWRWIFFVNLPLGFIALLWTLLAVGPDAPQARRPFDWRGFVLVAAALSLLIAGAQAAAAGTKWALPAAVALAIGAVVAWTAIRHLRRWAWPLVSLAPFGFATFAAVSRGGSLHRMAIGTVPFLLPLMFQLAFGLGPVVSGALLLWLFAGNIAMKLFTTGILKRFGFRNMMTVNGVLAAASITACGFLTPDMPYGLISAVLFVSGLTRSMQFTGVTTLQFADVKPSSMTDANTIAAMLQQTMLGFGVALGSGLVTAGALVRGGAVDLPAPADFRFAFVVLALLTLAGTIDFARLGRGAGARISGHRG